MGFYFIYACQPKEWLKLVHSNSTRNFTSVHLWFGFLPDTLNLTSFPALLLRVWRNGF